MSVLERARAIAAKRLAGTDSVDDWAAAFLLMPRVVEEVERLTAQVARLSTPREVRRIEGVRAWAMQGGE